MISSYVNVYVSHGEDLIGSKYKKVVYREFKSGEFTEEKKRTAYDEHLQILGEELGRATDCSRGSICWKKQFYN